MTKFPLLALIAFVTLNPAAADTTWQSRYTALLQKYVTPNGVKYQAWHTHPEDRAALQSVSGAIAAADLSSLSPNEQLAFYLNAYNANILDQILTDYPTKGPGGGSALGRAKFFKWNKIIVAGQKLSFSSLENDLIRKIYREPRIHFALNCASASCPPLFNQAFEAASLDNTLTTLTENYINRNPEGLRLDGATANLSQIFDWYQDDFANGNLIPYLNQYRTTQIPDNTTIEFMPYDWSLNETK
jgi:hypothetical protein